MKSFEFQTTKCIAEQAGIDWPNGKIKTCMVTKEQIVELVERTRRDTAQAINNAYDADTLQECLQEMGLL